VLGARETLAYSKLRSVAIETDLGLPDHTRIRCKTQIDG